LDDVFFFAAGFLAAGLFVLVEAGLFADVFFLDADVFSALGLLACSPFSFSEVGEAVSTSGEVAREGG